MKTSAIKNAVKDKFRALIKLNRLKVGIVQCIPVTIFLMLIWVIVALAALITLSTNVEIPITLWITLFIALVGIVAVATVELYKNTKKIAAMISYNMANLNDLFFIIFASNLSTEMQNYVHDIGNEITIQLRENGDRAVEIRWSVLQHELDAHIAQEIKLQTDIIPVEHGDTDSIVGTAKGEDLNIKV